MSVVLTGGTGLVGSAVLQALVDSGHDVSAIVRSDSSAEAVDAAGATPVLGDLTDADWLQARLAAADGAIHAASPGDATSAEFDRAVAQAAVAAFAGTGKAYVHTGGVWVYGANPDITEDTAFDPPALTAWREEVERLVLGADGVRGVIVVPAVVYGNGQGLPALLSNPDASGDYRLIGDGSQRWATVSADQIGDLYVRAYDNSDARGYYLGANADHPTVRELGETAAGSGTVVAETIGQSQARLGELLADALLLDQVARGDRARSELGWNPTGPSLIEEFRSGSYAGG